MVGVGGLAGPLKTSPDLVPKLYLDPPQSDEKSGLPKLITKGDSPEEALCYIEID